MISMTTIWEETSDFLKREQALLVPLWLGMFVVGDAGMSLSSAAMRAAGERGNILALLGFFASGLVAMSAQLAATAMVLRGGISVAEAISLGISRMPKLILLGLFSVFCALLAVMPLLTMLAASGVDVTSARPNLPLWAAFYMLALGAVGAWIGARLATLTPLIVDRNPPLLEAVQTAFAQTKGSVTRIIGAFVLYLLVALVVGGVVRLLIGGPILYIGRAAGLETIADVMAAVASGLVGGGLTLILSVFVAHLYKALNGKAVD